MNTDKIELLNPCYEAMEWLKTQPNQKVAYASCPRGDWLLWLAAKAQIDRKLVVKAACLCARESLQYVPEGEKRPLKAIETAEAWVRGEATIEEVQKAAAYAAANATYATYAAHAADATYAAHAADAADAATYAATYAAYAAHAAHAAAAAAAAAAVTTREDSLKKSAELVRSVISLRAFQKALRGIE